MKKIFLFFWAVALLPAIGYAQRNCGTQVYAQHITENYKVLTGRYGSALTEDSVRRTPRPVQGVITIPIAFHIVYHNLAQQLSEDLINQQVEILNDDYSGKNALRDRIPAAYRDRVADCEIRFVTDTVIYHYTDVKLFHIRPAGYDEDSEGIKFASKGGDDALPSTMYLNVWVGNITDDSPNQLLGYSTFPGGAGEYDGVVIFYKAFGPQNLMPQYNKGRTLTHEIGHWLNLRHIWGDDSCGTDYVQDTPPQKTYNSGCPACPHPTCTNAPNGDLLMDYMDYVDDGCMHMFTAGQKERMRSLFLEGGVRASIMQGVPENRPLLAARTDQNTATIKKVTENEKAIQITWDSVGAASRYKVLAKKVKDKDDEWIEIETFGNHAKLTGLNSGLYEVKVQTVLENNTIVPESTPYIISVEKGQVLKLNRLKVAE